MRFDSGVVVSDYVTRSVRYDEARFWACLCGQSFVTYRSRRLTDSDFSQLTPNVNLRGAIASSLEMQLPMINFYKVTSDKIENSVDGGWIVKVHKGVDK